MIIFLRGYYIHKNNMLFSVNHSVVYKNISVICVNHSVVFINTSYIYRK